MPTSLLSSSATISLLRNMAAYRLQSHMPHKPAQDSRRVPCGRQVDEIRPRRRGLLKGGNSWYFKLSVRRSVPPCPAQTI
jgi:hypothetical protein